MGSERYVFCIFCLLKITVAIFGIKRGLKDSTPCFYKNGTEYRILVSNVNVNNATQACAKHRSILAELESVEKIVFLRKKMKRHRLAHGVVGIKFCDDWLTQNGGGKLPDEIVSSIKPIHLLKMTSKDGCSRVALKTKGNRGRRRRASGFICQRASTRNTCPRRKQASYKDEKEADISQLTLRSQKRPSWGIPRRIKQKISQAVMTEIARAFTTRLPVANRSRVTKRQATAERRDTTYATRAAEAASEGSRIPALNSSTITGSDRKGLGSGFELHQTRKPFKSYSTSQQRFGSSSYQTRTSLQQQLNSSFYPTKSDTTSEQQFNSNLNSTRSVFTAQQQFNSSFDRIQSGATSQKLVKLSSYPTSSVFTSQQVSNSSLKLIAQGTVNLHTSVFPAHDDKTDKRHRLESSTYEASPPPELPESTEFTPQVQTHSPIELFVHNSAENPPKTVLSAIELLKDLSKALNESSSEEEEEVTISPGDLMAIADDLLPSLAPKHLTKPSHVTSNQGEINKNVADYALNFMKVTSQLLNPINTESWKGVADKNDEHQKELLTPSKLLESMDEVLDYSVHEFAKQQQETNSSTVIFESPQVEIRLKKVNISDDEILDLSEASFSSDTKLRKKRDAETITLSVLTADYKTVPHILSACSNISELDVKVSSNISQLANSTTENLCAQKGFLVSDKLCSEMLDEQSGNIVNAWVFPSTSNVLSITAFSGLKKQNLPVKFELQKGQQSLNETTRCVFYDTSAHLWSDYGCKVSMSGSYSCECNHTTNFAIMLLIPLDAGSQTEDVNVGSNGEETPFCKELAEMMSYIAGALSIVFLLVCVVFFWFARQTTERTVERNTVHMCLAISMLCLHLVLLADNSNFQNTSQDVATEPDWFCYVLAATTHFFLLCNFAWMTVEGILLYILVIKRDLRHKAMGKWKHLIGWLPPLCIVASTLFVGFLTEVPYLRGQQLTVNQSQVSGEMLCYLSKDLVWASVAPAAASLLLNFLIALKVVAVIARLTRDSQKYKPKSHQDTVAKLKAKAMRKSLTAFCKLNPILGLPWILGLAASFVPQPHRCYVLVAHTCVNGLQGVAFFFVCIVQTEESRDLVYQTWRKLQSNTQSFVNSFRPRRSSSYPLTPTHIQKKANSAAPQCGGIATITTPVVGARDGSPVYRTCGDMV